MLPKIDKIIVGVSLGADTTEELKVTDLDRAAFDNALWFASRCGAEVRLHHAIDWIGAPIETTAAALIDAATDRASALLLELSADAADAGITASTTISVGPARDGLLDAAERWGADLIVVGPRAHSTGLLGRIAYGSTARALARQATCHLWVVDASAPIGFKRPLVLVDLATELSNDMVEFGEWTRQNLEVDPELLHCVEFPADLALHRLPNADAEIHDYHKKVVFQAREKAKELLGDAISGWRWAILEDWVVRAAPRHAEEVSADLIMIAGTSKPGFAGKLLGSTAAKLIGRTTTSTFVFKQQSS